ncbi:IDEAL domain-containing protein [Paenibacillus planticolens]|uniref:IDEAL domain-containing protein n=1 Tax=Paenibacillus planticolens TaxID=2654976 RepID=A0ABX2A0V5_9BACL|nr:IDEAL domain-containing protein [Paenibacillus planticolens]NOV04623.1 IDEAL domain-containing protein [Paenibacillus planticolens]
MMNYQISDWVTATTNQDEMLHGYVESMDVLGGLTRIYVIASDRESAIGKVMEVSNQDVRKLPVSSLDIEEQVKSLIDVALAVRDEMWFLELTGKLLAIQQSESRRSERNVLPTLAFRNRLGVDQI